MNGNPDESIASPSLQSPTRKSKFVIISILILLIGGFLALIVILQPTQIKEQLFTSSPETTLIASIGRDEIFLEDVKGYARQQYQVGAIDNKVLKNSLDALIEERLLEKTGQEEDISVAEQEINEGLKEDGIDLTKASTIEKKRARLAVLKQKIKLRFVKTRTAYIIGFWIAPENYKGASVSQNMMLLIKQQRNDALPALTEIEKQLNAGKEPITLAKDVIKQYPSLKNIIAINGYFLKDEGNEILFKEPRLYTSEETKKDDNEASALYTTLFSLQPGQVAIARDTSRDAGGSVIKVIGASDGLYKDYDNWLAAQREKLVTINKPI